MRSQIGEPYVFKDGRKFPIVPGVAGGGLIFLSGQVAMGDNNEVVGATIQEQTHRTMVNIDKVLKSAGATLADVVKVTVFLTRPEDFSGFNEEYAKWFADAPPARSAVCTALVLPGFLVEVEVIAVDPKR